VGQRPVLVDSQEVQLLVHGLVLGLELLCLFDQGAHVLERLGQYISGCVLVNSHALGGQPVVGADDFEVELGADPHGVGVDPMSSTLEIIHKYHIISAQISAWEKPF